MKPLQNIHLLYLTLALAIVSSCTRTPDSLKAIPKNAGMVASVDLFSIARKAEVNNFKDLKIIQFLKAEANTENAEMQKLMEGLMSDPTKIGIDPLLNAYIFVDADTEKETVYTCFALDLISSDNFETFLTDVAKANEEEIKIEDKGSFKYTALSDQLNIAFDQDKVLLVVPTTYASREGLTDKVTALMSIDANENISKNSNFKAFEKKAKDLNVWLNMDNIIPERNLTGALSTYKGAEIEFFIDFQDDAINIDAGFTYGEEYQALIDEVPPTGDGLNQDLLKLFPENYLAVGSSNFNPEFLIKVLEKDPSSQQIFMMAQMQTGQDVKALINTLGGSIVFSLHDFTSEKVLKNEMNWETFEMEEKEVDQLMPKMGLAIDINDKGPWENIMMMIPSALADDKGTYKTIAQGGFPVHFGLMDNYLHISTDETAFTGGYDNHLKISPVGKVMSSSNSHLSVITNFKKYPEALQNKLTESNRQANTFFDIFGEEFETIEATSTSNYDANIRFEFKKGGNNVLNDIITLIDKNYETMMTL